MRAAREERNKRMNVNNSKFYKSPSLLQRSSDLIIAEHKSGPDVFGADARVEILSFATPQLRVCARHGLILPSNPKKKLLLKLRFKQLVETLR